MSAHKPRRKVKKYDLEHETPIKAGAIGQVDSINQKPTFPLAALYWSARKGVSQWTVLPLTLMIAGLLRWATSLWGYSGLYSEIELYMADLSRIQDTTNAWRLRSAAALDGDHNEVACSEMGLQLGIMGEAEIDSGSYINPSWFALDSSRGMESPDLKLFMRATVLISEFFVYIPALVIFNRRFAKQSGLNTWQTSIALTAVLLQPSTILIDHAHFQYNTVMLGFTLAAMANMLAGRYLWSSVFFVAALNFKQMALYYAPVVFAYLLGVCVQPRLRIVQLLAIALTTIAAFIIVFSPLLFGSFYNHWRDPTLDFILERPPLMNSLFELSKSTTKSTIAPGGVFYPLILQLSQAIHRIFPLARGLFEDKVANAWCAIHTVYKLNRFSTAFLSRLSLVATLAAISPSMTILFLSPKKWLIPYAFASCAWGFFLCSFQVHEKSVLLPLLPMTVLLAGERGLSPEVRAWVGWANILGTWTMFPLLKRDELRVPYAICTLLWAYLLGLPPASISIYTNSRNLTFPVRILHLSYYAFMLFWHFAEAFIPPPGGKPDLWVVINCVVGAAGFGICYLWSTWQLLIQSDLGKRLGILPSNTSVSLQEPRTVPRNEPKLNAKQK